MPSETIAVKASEGGAFDGYLAKPDDGGQAPAVVLACSIDGVDADLRQIADEFAAAGYIAIAPDLFWRTLPGPLPSGDPRTMERSLPRLEKLAANERDLRDTLAFLGTLPHWNGRAAVMGFCYGGPFAILGPRKLGYDAGVSCHGSQMLDFVGDLEGVAAPVCIIWGDQDHLAPQPVLDAYRDAAERMPNVEVAVFPGVEHGYMMPGSPEVFDAEARDGSMQRTFAILARLRDAA